MSEKVATPLPCPCSSARGTRRGIVSVMGVAAAGHVGIVMIRKCMRHGHTWTKPTVTVIVLLHPSTLYCVALKSRYPTGAPILPLSRSKSAIVAHVMVPAAVTGHPGVMALAGLAVTW